MSIKPMLASGISNIKGVRYPILGSLKLDGIRCLIHGGKPVSRTLKLIPNLFVQEILSDPSLEGLDGELIVGDMNDPKGFNKTTSGIMSRDGEPDFTFHVFDTLYHGSLPYTERYKRIPEQIEGRERIKILDLKELFTEEDLLDYEGRAVLNGYEGVCLRDPNGPYKFGRSTEKEGYLLKMKRFEDDEAVIIGFEEALSNQNKAMFNIYGNIERSSHKENMIPKNTLGKIIVRSFNFTEEFGIGSGFDDAQRKHIWENKELYLHTIVKYKFQPHGVKDRPRLPIFLGFRKD